jgi:hypothetical protein
LLFSDLNFGPSASITSCADSQTHRNLCFFFLIYSLE